MEVGGAPKREMGVAERGTEEVRDEEEEEEDVVVVVSGGVRSA